MYVMHTYIHTYIPCPQRLLHKTKSLFELLQGWAAMLHPMADRCYNRQLMYIHTYIPCPQRPLH